MTQRALITNSSPARRRVRLQPIKQQQFEKQDKIQDDCNYNFDKLLSSLKSDRYCCKSKTAEHWTLINYNVKISEADKKEINLLEQFCNVFKYERNFSQHKFAEKFIKIFRLIIKNRLKSEEWRSENGTQSIHVVLRVLHFFVRDAKYLDEFIKLDCIDDFSVYFDAVIYTYFNVENHDVICTCADIIYELTNIFQKLACHKINLTAFNIHMKLIHCLESDDSLILQSCLHTLVAISLDDSSLEVLVKHNFVDSLLKLLQENDPNAKVLACKLLRNMSGFELVRSEVLDHNGLIILLSLLNFRENSLSILRYAVWCLVQMARGNIECREGIRNCGGIPVILSLLSERNFYPDRQNGLVNPASATTRRRRATSEEEIQEVNDQRLQLKSTCCAALAELSRSDSCAHQIVQANGIFIVSILLFNIDTPSSYEERIDLQKNVFRALRFLFSLERNRRYFKRLFPPRLLEPFLDVGNYKNDLQAYETLITILKTLNDDEVNCIRSNIEGINLNTEPLRQIEDYAILELLGSGSFGSVYRAKKIGGQTQLAIKEINTMQSNFGNNSFERQKSVGDLNNEINIIKEQLQHPNIVKYYRTFVDNNSFCIAMELIEGAALQEHIASLKERKEQFTEDRIWKIFVQIVRALRYLHKEKKILHRDLSANNIMLSDGDKVTITDFGLAKRKTPDVSKLQTTVGTILYCCPEMVQNEKYGEKADIWSVGCILYQMCTLKPPFYSQNMLHLAKMIVEAKYEPIPKTYSNLVSSTLAICLTTDPDKRADIIQVAAHMSDIILQHMDSLELQIQRQAKLLESEQNRLHVPSRMVSYDSRWSSSGTSGAHSLQDNAETPEEQKIFVRNTSVQETGSDDENSTVDSVGLPPKPPTHKPAGVSLRRKHRSTERLKDTTNNDSTEMIETRTGSGGKIKSRPNSGGSVTSGSTTLSISQKNLRQINDPVSSLLTELHKIMYVCQMPPSPIKSYRRTLIERFKKTLFVKQSNASFLKEHLLKLEQGSKELVKFYDQLASEKLCLDALKEWADINDEMLDQNFVGITYEQLRNIIDSCLNEIDYDGQSKSVSKYKRTASLR